MKKTTILSFVLVVILTNAVHAQDRFFAFTNQSNVLPKGTRAVELWYANKSGGDAYYRGNFTRVGFKMGLGKNILTQFYANLNSVAQIENEIDHTDHKTRMFSAGIVQTTEATFSNETKIKLLDPVANAIGLAAYGEFTIGPKYTRITPKLIMDKRSGNNFFVFNILAEIENRWDTEGVASDIPTSIAPKVIKEKEIPFEFGLAYMRFFKNDKFGLGFEVRNHNEVIDIAGWEHSALFLGPALHIQDDKWFFNITALPQIANLKKTWIAPANKVLDEHQNFELRTQLGFMF
jgi:hypothetical protein